MRFWAPPSSDADKAKQMLEMFPQLPADGQEEVARHLSNLVPDRGLRRCCEPT